MTTTESGRRLAPRYEPAGVEPRIYERWLTSGAFAPAADPPPGADRFVIVQPPPNVTGALHLGHALTATVEDIFVRYHRMRGDDTLWLPGADHASIGAQFVLDKIIAEEGESRQSLGRERYLDRMWRFMDETRPVIGQQHRRLGASVDWSRERFTMDEGSARAVRTAFKRLWDAGLAYRGEALVNWCPRCRTTISDLENVHREEPGTLWTLRYHLASPDGTPDPSRWISVATTRPETLLGDTAVAVHPGDERYASLVGATAILPFLGRALPIVADDAVDPAFGTGAVKITPAHDPNDYELGKRHGLAAISVLDEAARINEAGGEFAGLDRYEARTAILERLREAGDLEDERAHTLNIGRCERCGTAVEPRLSVGWFVHVKPLAERALASVREGRTRIVPAHYEKVYAHWMENIHDWAVGRQLWWGHRIPAWYCPDGHISVTDAPEGPDACGECGAAGDRLQQETDIFDTWFSSALWPFSTLGWPDDTPDMRRFYPTSVMETGYDILFFWVARMMMMGLFCTDVEPFHTVYLHGLIRLEGGVKMSKTKGNVIDPLGMVEEIGADALRYALVAGTTPGVDQRLAASKLDGARNFTNKLWNAARFVIGARPETVDPGSAEATLPERWIRSRLAAVVERTTQQLDDLDVGGVAATLHEFAWSDLCDWFLEVAKVDLRRADATDEDRARIWLTAAEVLAEVVRLLHPVMPFVTEEIWETLRVALPGERSAPELLVAAPWPAPGDGDEAAERDFEALAELVRSVRNLRTSTSVPAGAWVPLSLVAGTPAGAALIGANTRYLEQLARVRPVELLAADAPRPPALASTPIAVAWVAQRQGGASDGGDRDAGTARIAAELEQRIERLRGLLSTGSFVERAPAAVVEKERARLRDLEAELAQLGKRSSQ